MPHWLTNTEDLAVKKDETRPGSFLPGVTVATTSDAHAARWKTRMAGSLNVRQRERKRDRQRSGRNTQQNYVHGMTTEHVLITVITAVRVVLCDASVLNR